eukprot:1160293-Pelagomonas_calceolata.AAC.10
MQTRSSSSNSSIKSEASASSVTHAECLKESCLCMHWMQGQPSPHADTEQQQLSRSAFSSAIRAECRRMLFRGCASFEEALESELRSLKVASAFYRLARHSIWFFSKAQLILLATSELLVRKALLYARSLFAGIDFSSAFSFNIALLSSQCVLNSCDIHSCLIHPVYPCINYGLWFRAVKSWFSKEPVKRKAYCYSFCPNRELKHIKAKKEGTATGAYLPFPASKIPGGTMFRLNFWQAPVMRREPFRFACFPVEFTPAALAYPAHPLKLIDILYTLHPETLATLPYKAAWQLCSVRCPWEAVAAAVGMFATSYVYSLGPEPASPSTALELSKLAKQNLHSGCQVVVTRVAASKVGAWPPQAPGTVDTKLISILFGMPLLGPGPGGGLVWGLCILFRLHREMREE